MVLTWRLYLVTQHTVLCIVVFTVGGRIVGAPMRLFPIQAASVAFDQHGPFAENPLDRQERV
jgi:hypothetical protein